MSEKVTLQEKRPYSEFFWSVFSQNEYEEIQSTFPYLAQMLENTNQKTLNSNIFHAVSTCL